MTPQPTNDHESSGKVSIPKALALGWLTFSFHFFVALIVCAYMMMVVPRYKMFADNFGAELSTAAVSAIRLSDLVVNYWYLMLLAVIIVGGPMAIALRFLPDKLRWIRSCWLVAWPTAAVVFLFFESLILALVVERLTTRPH